MKILITGAKGQLGRDCEQVLATKNVVHGFGSKELDITNRQQVEERIISLRPDIVLNCAAYTAVDKCESDRDKCRRVNAEGPGILAELCAETGARLIHISTDYVFDGAKPAPEPYLETDPVHPLSQYGAAKLAGEENIRKTLDNHLILRTAWLYGMGGPNFLKTMLRLALNNPGQPLRVVNDQHGALTWTYRLAQQIKVLLVSDITGTCHATAEGHTTWYEGAKLFLETMQVPFAMNPCSTADYPTPAKRPANSILANHNLKTHNLNKMLPWEQDVTQFANQFRNQLLAEIRG